MDINQLKNIIRIGRVSSVTPATHSARVTFPDKEGLVTADLPVMVPMAKDNKVYWLPDVDSQVICAFVPNPSGSGLNEGVILGCIYSEVDRPSQNSEVVKSIETKDGSFIRFNNGVLEIHGAKAIKLTAPKIDLN